MNEIVNLFNNKKWIDAPGYPGGTQKRILHDENGVKTVLLKFPEGFYMEPHAHINAEQHFILKGEYISEGKVFHAGTFQSFKAHENHGPFESKKGALVLVIWFPQ
ncbi:MAG: cupin domain-containing protein [Prolixibacteraceae bacterium]|nr:cupin domain-containing protein [Prolixibacteraceae bacterium]